MTAKQDFRELDEGYEFPAAAYPMEAGVIRDYLKAVSDASGFFADGKLVPPMAVAARAMISLADHIELPPGSIHVQQQLAFHGAVAVGDTINCRATLSRKRDRGRFHLITVALEVTGGGGDTVMTGSTVFMLPEGGGA